MSLGKITFTTCRLVVELADEYKVDHQSWIGQNRNLIYFMMDISVER